MNWSQRKVLVTGGAGFIGSHLVQRLLSLGADLRVLDNLSTGLRSNLDLFVDHIEFLEGDIRNRELCSQATEDCEFVFHQAALGSVPRSIASPVETVEVNVQGTTTLFAAAAASSVGQVIYASSSSVYGDSTASPKVEGQEGSPLSPYAASKAAVESVAAGFANCFDTRFVGLRYFNVYGPRQSQEGPYAAVIPRFINAAIGNEPLVVFGDGEQTRDFTYVDDVVQANLLAAAVEATEAISNVSSGKATSVLGLAQEILASTGSASQILHDPPRKGDVRHSLASLEQAKNLLGYHPQCTLKTGLAATLEHASSRSLA